jgi:hypothetical protein
MFKRVLTAQSSQEDLASGLASFALHEYETEAALDVPPPVSGLHLTPTGVLPMIHKAQGWLALLAVLAGASLLVAALMARQQPKPEARKQ